MRLHTFDPKNSHFRHIAEMFQRFEENEEFEYFSIRNETKLLAVLQGPSGAWLLAGSPKLLYYEEACRSVMKRLHG